MNIANLINKLNSLLIVLKLENNKNEKVVEEALLVLAEQQNQLEVITESRNFWKNKFYELTKV